MLTGKRYIKTLLTSFQRCNDVVCLLETLYQYVVDAQQRCINNKRFLWLSRLLCVSFKFCFLPWNYLNRFQKPESTQPTSQSLCVWTFWVILSRLCRLVVHNLLTSTQTVLFYFGHTVCNLFFFFSSVFSISVLNSNLLDQMHHNKFDNWRYEYS